MVNAVRAHFESEDVRFDDLIGLSNCYAVITEKTVRISFNFFYLLNILIQEVTTATLSPDATALALGTADGHVRFYILENLDDVRFAHSWQPHVGKPVDVITFLDNLKEKPQYVVEEDGKAVGLWTSLSGNSSGSLR